MIKEEISEVKEVDVVLAVIKEYFDKGQDMPYEKLEYVVQKFSSIREDYNTILKNLSNCNSLVVKMERLFEVIGTIGTISIEDEANLDRTLKLLEGYVNTNK